MPFVQDTKGVKFENFDSIPLRIILKLYIIYLMIVRDYTIYKKQK